MVKMYDREKSVPRVTEGYNITQREGVRAIESLLRYLGEDITREGLIGTPERVLKAFREMTEGYSQDPQEILGKYFTEPYDEMVIVKDIPFFSLCEHHMLSFSGVCTIGYLPKGRVVGLSKLPRLVHCFAKRLQIQERLTQEIAGAIKQNVRPLGVGVAIKASHLCMKSRGIRSEGEMITTCLLGAMKNDQTAKSEFLSLLEGWK